MMSIEFESVLMEDMKKSNNPSGLPDLEKHIKLADPKDEPLHLPRKIRNSKYNVEVNPFQKHGLRHMDLFDISGGDPGRNPGPKMLSKSLS